MPLNFRKRRQQKTRRRWNRAHRLELLENRRLLVAEGAEFNISQSFDTTGLVGSLTSTIDWGDGTESSASVNGSVGSGPLSVRFEYMGSFFTQARRNVLEAITDSVVERFSDDLAAITPGGIFEWDAVTQNPLNGSTLTIPNLSVGANELVIYVGAHNLPGSRVGEAGPGSYGFDGFAGTVAEVAQVEAFRENVRFRGESGAALGNPTDIGPWGGFIAFDSDTNWHFGLSTDGLDEDEVDFASVAIHELMHVLGLGVEYAGSTNSSWETYSNGTSFTGPKARAEFGGNVPLEDSQHFANSVESRGQQSAVTPVVPRGIRKILTPLDLATLDDLGWTVGGSQNATVTASHVYPDNPTTGSTYPVEITIRGSQLGEITTTTTATVTNRAPVLTVPGNQAATVGIPISIVDIGSIVDEGFRNNNADPPTSETFDYVISWGDGTVDSGAASIDRFGNATNGAEASFDGTHTYEATGTYTVRVQAIDDDGGSDTEEFSITVAAPPALTLRVSPGNVHENDGAGASTVTIIRSGPALSTNQTIQLTSSDTSEATVPPSATILAGQTSVDVSLAAVDDSLLDGTQVVTITASGTGVESGEQTLNVFDYETLRVNLSTTSIVENSPSAATLLVTRSNTDRDLPVSVNVGGGNTAQLNMPSTLTIPADQSGVSVQFQAVDDAIAELAQTLAYQIAATGYEVASFDITLLDDEPPLFQNILNQFDVDSSGGVSAVDALRVINELARRSTPQLNPATEDPGDVFLDVNGDYRVSAVDALLTINFISRQRSESSSEPESELQLLDSLLQSDFLSLRDHEDN